MLIIFLCQYTQLDYYFNNGAVDGMIRYPYHYSELMKSRKLKAHKLNDNQWHTISAEKRGSTLILTVDDHCLEEGFTGSDDIIADTSKKLYIGGVPGKIYNSSTKYRIIIPFS